MSAWLAQITASPHCTRLWSRGLLNGHALHRDLMRLAADNLGDQPRKTVDMLWRAEEARNSLQILVQMTTKPALEHLNSDFAHAARERDLTPLLDRLETGSRVRYRIAANATKRHGNTAEPNKKGKLANLHGAAADEWWLRRAEQAGLRPLQVISTSLPDVLGPPTRDRNNTKQVVQHAVTRFDGIGVVTDPERLRAAVRDGIGRARTYGCGLLSLGPITGPRYARC